MMQRKKWLAGLAVGAVITGALWGTACNDDADSPGEVRETAQDGIEDVGKTAEDVADDAKDSIDDAVGDEETATPTP